MSNYKSAKRGWYKLVNPHKLIKPLDEYMGSCKIIESSLAVEYKSSLELIAIKYCDFNKFVTKFSVEPFNIKYIKPTDNREHRYFIDLYMEFSSGDKFIVEIKSKSETIQPKKPKKLTEKNSANYQKALTTWAINNAKWKAAKEFAELNSFKFIILTEDELKSKSS